MPTLLILKGTAAEKTVRLPGDGGRLVIGRGRGSDVVLRDDGGVVSRRHAEISAGAGGFTVVDLGSRNGVWRRGSRIAAAALDAGEPIVIGPYQLLLASDDAVARPITDSMAATAEEPAGGTAMPWLPASPALLIAAGILVGLVAGGFVMWVLVSAWSGSSASRAKELEDRAAGAFGAVDASVLACGPYVGPSSARGRDPA